MPYHFDQIESKIRREKEGQYLTILNVERSILIGLDMPNKKIEISIRRCQKSLPTNRVESACPSSMLIARAIMKGFYKRSLTKIWTNKTKLCMFLNKENTTMKQKEIKRLQI